MKKYIVAACLVCFACPVLAETEVFYVIRDNTTEQCQVVKTSELSDTQKARFKQLGKYATLEEANAAMESMVGTKQCPKM